MGRDTLITSNNTRPYETSFRSIIEALGEGVLITDLDDNVLYCNTRLTEITGYTAEEMLGRPAYELLLPVNEWPNLRERNRQRSLNISDRYETPMLRKNGEIWWAEVHATPLFAEDGTTIIGTIGCNTDITERKRAEAETEKLLAELRYVAGSAHCFLWHAEVTELGSVAGLGWKMATPATDNAPLLFPVALREGEDFFTAWYRSRLPEDRIAGDSIADSRIRAGQNFHREFRYYGADGQIRWASEDVAVTVVEPGRKWYAVGVCTDITERKQAERAQEASRQLMRQVIDQANCLLWRAEVRERVSDPDWTTGVYFDTERGTKASWDLRIVNEDANSVPSWLPVSREQGETITEAWIRSRHPDDDVQMGIRANEALQANQPGYTQIFRNRMADGTFRWIYENVHIEEQTPLRGPEDTEPPLRQWLLTGVATDITERRQAELEREASQQQLRQVTEQANCLLWRAEVREEIPNPGWQPRIFDPGLGSTLNWNLELVNENEILRWLPLEPNEGESLRDAWYFSRDPEDRESGDATSWNCLASGQDRYTQTFRIRVRDGIRWLQEDVRVEPLEPLRSATNGPENRPLRRWQLTGVLTDITERKRVEEELRTSRTQLVTAVEAGGMGTWIWDIPGNRLWLDDSMLKIWGRRRDEVDTGNGMGNLSAFMQPDDRANLEQNMRAVFQEGTTAVGEFRITRPDNTVRWIAYRGCLERDALGRPVRMTGVNTDITERKQAEEAQIRSQKLEALGTLAGGIAHDFNNILSAILGNAQLASLELSPEHPVQETLAEITRAGSRSTDLIRRILAFSRPQEQNRKPLALQPIVTEVLNLLRATLPATLEIRTAFAPDIPPVIADSTQVHQVLVNLATNAAHAIGAPGGLGGREGRIEIHLETLDITGDWIGDQIASGAGLPAGRYARLSVSDNGCGMDRATLARIFDPFFTTKPAGEGTGLGLSVVHGIMKSHGGTVTVYSQPGAGSTFRLYFPAATGVVAAPAAPSESVPRTTRKHILYVDDEEAIVLFARRVLERMGHSVTSCTNSTEAFRQFQASPHEFDMVITDLSMPGMSGFDLAGHLLEIRPDITIILTSGYIRPEQEEAARRSGIREVLLKPFNLTDLLKAIPED